MSATRTRDEAPAAVPQTTPTAIGYGHPEYQFVQAIMEMQKSLGEINASIQSLRGEVGGIKSKVDNLVAWKHMILGGAIVLGVAASAVSFIIVQVRDYVTFKIPAAQTQPNTSAPQAPQTPPQPPSSGSQQ